MPFINISRSSIFVVSAGSTKALICVLSVTLSRIVARYSFLSIWFQSTHCLRECFSMRSSQMRVLRPLPSINGWATLHKFGCTRPFVNKFTWYSFARIFISMYLSIISSKVVSGIRSIVCSVAGKCMQLANVKPPLDIFLVRIFPAKSYNPPKR